MKKTKILVIGSSNTDMTVPTDRLPLPGETVMGGELKMGQGGKGANQAVAAKRLGAEVVFACKLGNDIFGDNAIKAYERDGIDTSCVLRCGTPSGVALITVDSKAENSIVVASGANACFSVADIENLTQEIESASILLMQLEIPVPSVTRAAQIARKAGVKVVLNPAPAAVLPAELIACTDILIPNETELSKISGVQAGDRESTLKAVEALRVKGAKDVIVTLGSKGSLVCEDGKEPVEVPACKVKAVDTTAAGDTFCGGLCTALSCGRSLVEAVQFATKASSLTVQKMGAQDSIPYLSEIQVDCNLDPR